MHPKQSISLDLSPAGRILSLINSLPPYLQAALAPHLEDVRDSLLDTDPLESYLIPQDSIRSLVAGFRRLETSVRATVAQLQGGAEVMQSCLWRLQGLEEFFDHVLGSAFLPALADLCPGSSSSDFSAKLLMDLNDLRTRGEECCNNLERLGDVEELVHALAALSNKVVARQALLMDLLQFHLVGGFAACVVSYAVFERVTVHLLTPFTPPKYLIAGL